jgi:hypothetical protein
MKNYNMPIGKITFFEGEITKLYPKAFGGAKPRSAAAEVDIIAPPGAEGAAAACGHPIIQTKLNTGNGLRTGCSAASAH